MDCSSIGDAGDIIYALGVIRQIPDGPHTLCLRYGNSTKYRDSQGIQKLLELIGPLAVKQHYIADAKVIDPSTPVDWASERFRDNGLFFAPGESLMQAHLNNLIKVHSIGRDFSLDEPWLSVDPSPTTKGRIVINRTERYRNDFFSWSDVVRHYGDRLLFIGLPHEHQQFCDQFGRVEFTPTSNMLDTAELIAGSDLFIGNQSCANAINEGLKHRSIQETCLWIPDCVFRRANGVFCGFGDCLLPDIGGSGEHQMKFTLSLKDINPSVVPPGGWQFPGEVSQQHIGAAASLLSRNHRDLFPTPVEARAAVLRHNYERIPSFFSNVDMGGFKFKLAMQNAGQKI